MSVLNQKVGKAILITDNSQSYYPAMYDTMNYGREEINYSRKETVAIGEIEIITNVNVSFLLE